MNKVNYHESVLRQEILKIIGEGGTRKLKVIDATLGTAGHTIEFLKQGWEVLGIETDRRMLEIASERISDFSTDSYKFLKENFRLIDRIAEENNFTNCDAILFDLGVSNLQLISRQRGFSFSNKEAELDMRIDQERQTLKALDLLNVLRLDQLEKMFLKVLDKNVAKKLAKETVSFRKEKKIEKIKDFIEICDSLNLKKSLNKATLPLLALRISVNSEYENLSEALPKAFEILKKEGKLLVISFHSGEDRIVKDYFKSLENKGLAKLFEVIIPSNEEIERNPRSRSAKLRYLRKI